MNQVKNIFLLSLMIAFFSSCEEIFEGDEGEVGREYLEFKADGETFESVGIPAQCNALIFNYLPEPHLDLPAGYMVMRSNNCVDSTSLTMTFQRVTPEYTGSSSLEFLDFAESFRPSFQTKDMTYNRLLDGTITIDQFTGAHKHGSGRLSGTFEMRLTDSQKTDTLNITEGRFNFFIPQKLH